MFNLQYEPYELLHAPVQPFDFEKQDAEQIEQEMIRIMQANDGLGLAANQIGLNARIFVMGSNKINGFCKPQAFINPKILRYSEEMKSDREGCLSFPGLFLNVKRPAQIEAEYYTLKGEREEIRVTGYMAKCFQHEFDHLNGICYTNRVGRLKLDMALKKLSKKFRR